MSKSITSRFSIYVVFISSIMMFLGIAEALGDNIAPEVQTQINKRSDLFQKSVEDLGGLEKSLEQKKQATINAIGDGETNTPQGLNSITKQSKSELENESGKLESIHENDLNSRGREEMIKKNSINELYPDYSRPLNKQFMKDAKALSEGQNELLANLFAKLKKFAQIDCKTIKGDKKHEPEYFLKVKTTEHKDTIYNQTFCEELRNRYNCTDTVTLKCKKKGMKWDGWQDKEIHIGYEELFKSGKMVFWVDHTGNSCFEYKLSLGISSGLIGAYRKKSIPDPYKILAMREFLTTKHKEATIDNISTEMSSSWYGDGSLRSISGWSWGGRVLGSKDYAWQVYFVKYRYRDGKPACLEWEEDLNQDCRLQ